MEINYIVESIAFRNTFISYKTFANFVYNIAPVDKERRHELELLLG